METVPRQEQSVAARDQSVSELVSQLSEQVSRLVKNEMRLARLEMTRKGKEAGAGAGMLGASGVIALYGVACLLACAVIAIATALPAWLSALIVGAALFAAAGIVGLAGRSRLRRATPPVPGQAAGNVRADIEEIRGRAHR